MFETDTTLAVILFGLAAACMILSGIAIITALRRMERTTTRWRDPAPLLFRLLLPLTRLLARALPPLPGTLARPMKKQLDRAGMGYAILATEFVILRVLTGLLGFCLGISLLKAFAVSSATATLTVASATLLGFFYPVVWLSDYGKRRCQRIERAFPALLELLTLSVRAGLSFSVALEQCTEQMEPGPLAEELRRVNREIRTGQIRQEALEHMSQRIDIPAVHNFVSAIIQADETGAAISKTLSDQAAQQRRERFNNAEKKANEAPVKLLLPLVGLLFPLTFLIIGFPIVMQFMDGGLL